MAGLVQLLGVEGEAETEGGAGVELGAVGESGDTAVVDLGLKLKGREYVLAPKLFHRCWEISPSFSFEHTSQTGHLEFWD